MVLRIFIHKPTPELQISNSAPCPVARLQPAAAPSGYFPISGTLLALYIVYLAVLFFQSTSAKKRRGSTSRSTRTVNPKLGFLGLFGFAGFLGFWTYRVDQTIFPFVFFVFFGFFGFFYERKMSNTLIDERYKENKMRAQSTANKTALSIIFLQY